jgi:hypothetical protein
MAAYDVVKVKPVGPARLAVEFADGLRGEVEFRSTFFHGVFEALADPSVFATVRCDQGFVEWSGDLDLAPDAMHEAIKEHGVWLLET